MEMTTGTQVQVTCVHSIGSLSTAGSGRWAGSRWDLCKVGLGCVDPAPPRPHLLRARPSQGRPDGEWCGLTVTYCTDPHLRRLSVLPCCSSVWREVRPFSRQLSVRCSCSAPPRGCQPPLSRDLGWRDPQAPVWPRWADVGCALPSRTRQLRTTA